MQFVEWYAGAMGRALGAPAAAGAKAARVRVDA